MPEFKGGQLVAVRYGSSWEPRIFRRKDDDGLWCMDFLSRGASPYAQEDVEPAEAVWPEIFIGLDRGALVQRLRKQIRWLCGQIMVNALHRKQTDFCPPFDKPIGPNGLCQISCSTCWEQASLKAVKGDKDE